MLENMVEFFEKRVAYYDEHMINEVEGCKNAYIKLAQLVPHQVNHLLDLGCGTGLELEEIFKHNPRVKVTGVDLTTAMLEKLANKYPDKEMTLIEGDYLAVELGQDAYEAAISCETMHHLSHHEKIGVYTKIYHALKEHSPYIECDYMVLDQAEEDFYYAEYERLKKEQNISDHTVYHYDTPCTIENQKKLLLAAGFSKVEMLWREGNTTIILAEK